MIEVCCPSCSRRDQASEFLRGMTMICKGCGLRLTVPGEGQESRAAPADPVVIVTVEPEPPVLIPPPAPAEAPVAPGSDTVVKLLAGASAEESPSFFLLRSFPSGTTRLEKVFHAILFTVAWLFLLWALIDLLRGMISLVPQPDSSLRSPGAMTDISQRLEQYIAWERGAGLLVLAAICFVLGVCLQGVRLWLAYRLLDRAERRQLLRRLGKHTEEDEDEPAGVAICGAVLGAALGFFFGPALFGGLMAAVGGHTAGWLVVVAALLGLFLGPLLAGYVIGYLGQGIASFLHQDD